MSAWFCPAVLGLGLGSVLLGADAQRSAGMARMGRPGAPARAPARGSAVVTGAARAPDLTQRHHPQVHPVHQSPSFAARRAAISILLIPSIACMTLLALSASGSPRSSFRMGGTICHDRPYLSLSQPHRPGSPPLVSLSHRWSISSWPTAETNSEMASVNVNSVPPLRAWIWRPSRVNVTDIALPGRSGPPSPYRETPRIHEFGNMET